MRIDSANLEFLFKVHKMFPESLVGYNPRSIATNSDGSLKYIWRLQQSYTMMLTGAAFVSRYNIEKYWRKEYEDARALVSAEWNCEDILMNVVCGTRPYFVKTGKEFQKQFGNGVSSKSGHNERRSVCLNTFVEMFGDAFTKHNNMIAISSL